MREEKPEITDAVEAVYALTAELDRGQILTHEAIREVLGVDPHVGSWDHIVNRVRRRLQNERGIATWPDITVGYRLLTHAEQLELPGWRMKRGLRQVRRGRKSLDALAENGLTMHQRRARLFTLDRLRETERTLRADMRALRQQIKPSSTTPRRPVPA